MGEVKPILFSGPMVRAILEGRKTQTRRALSRRWTVLGESWQGKKSPWEGLRFGEAVARHWEGYEPHLAVPFCHPEDEPCPSEDCGIYRVRPPYETGDLLWVRESWRADSPDDPQAALYMATHTDPLPTGFKWKPSIHMPRWASRLTLEVTAVKVERLQDISEADAKAEGIEFATAIGITGGWIDYEDQRRGGPSFRRYADPRESYRTLWTVINGAESWSANPWVTAITFNAHQQNIDAYLASLPPTLEKESK